MFPTIAVSTVLKFPVWFIFAPLEFAVATTDGRTLVVTDHGTEVVSFDNAASDLFSTPERPGAFVALRAADDETPGEIVQYKRTLGSFDPTDIAPFEAPWGRVLVASWPPLVTAQVDAPVLDYAGLGGAFPVPASAGTTASRPWVFAYDGLVTELALNESGYAVVAHRPVDAVVDGCSRVVERRGEFLSIEGGPTSPVRLRGLSVKETQTTGCVIDALALPSGRVVALVGPDAKLVWFGREATSVVPLGVKLPLLAGVSHRLAPAGARVVVALDSALVVAHEGGVELELAIAAHAVARIW